MHPGKAYISEEKRGLNIKAVDPSIGQKAHHAETHEQTKKQAKDDE
jgi:hypothetical protein